MGICGILTIIFVVLKVLSVGIVANWSWWLVLSPILIPIAIWFVFMLMAFLVVVKK